MPDGFFAGPGANRNSIVTPKISIGGRHRNPTPFEQRKWGSLWKSVKVEGKPLEAEECPSTAFDGAAKPPLTAIDWVQWRMNAASHSLISGQDESKNHFDASIRCFVRSTKVGQRLETDQMHSRPHKADGIQSDLSGELPINPLAPLLLFAFIPI